MIVTHHIPDKEILLNARSERQAFEYVCGRIGSVPSRLWHDVVNRIYVCEVETADQVESTAVVVGMIAGPTESRPVRRLRRHPKEGTWPQDVEFKD
jgi:hypothetical protein